LRANLTRLAVSTALVILTSAVFHGHRAEAATGRVTIDVDAQKRDFLLIEYGRLKRKPRTLIIVLRGAGSRARNASTDRRGIGLSPVVKRAGVVIAYPESLDNKWNLDGKSDSSFIRGIVSKLVSDGIVDKKRVFVAGISSGGMLAMKIACENPDYIAGVAALISTMPTGLAASCKIGRPTPFFLMNGTSDPVIPYEGGKSSLRDYTGDVASTDATLAPFLAAAQCGKEHTTMEMPDRDPADGSRVSIDRFTGCKAIVELARVTGGGHTLPGRPTRSDRGVAVGAQNNDVSTPRVLWDFVRRSLR
jgi:polyhydroxybutyrate depolymerase